MKMKEFIEELEPYIDLSDNELKIVDDSNNEYTIDKVYLDTRTGEVTIKTSSL